MTNQMITHRLPMDYSLISLISSISYVCHQGMAKPIRALELHYLMIQFLIINVITLQEPIPS